MNKFTIILSNLAVAAIAALFFSACSSNTVTPPSGSVSSNVAVTSATTTSVTVSWMRDPSDASADTIFVTSGSQLVGQTIVASGSSGTVVGLTIDVPYSIVVASSIGRTTAISYTIAALPTNLMVNAMSASSIGAKWTRDASDYGDDTIVAMNGSTVVSSTPTMASNGIVTGLAEGTVYSISIHMSSGATASIPWMTAERTTGIKIYEKADPDAGDPSALVLAANGTGAVSLTGATNADFVLDDDASLPSGISFEAGAVFNALWNDTRVNPNANYIVGGLNNDYRGTDYSQDIIAANDNAYNLPNDASYGTKGSAVLTCQTASGNLALIEIVPDANTGMLYSTTADGYKYVTVNVSYQSVVNTPYAGRGHARGGMGTVERISAH